VQADLAATQTKLSAAESKLTTAQASLDSTRSKLSATEGELSAAKAAAEAAQGEGSTCKLSLTKAHSVLEAQSSRLRELQAIEEALLPLWLSRRIVKAQAWAAAQLRAARDSEAAARLQAKLVELSAQAWEAAAPAREAAQPYVEPLRAAHTQYVAPVLASAAVYGKQAKVRVCVCVCVVSVGWGRVVAWAAAAVPVTAVEHPNLRQHTHATEHLLMQPHPCLPPFDNHTHTTTTTTNTMQAAFDKLPIQETLEAAQKQAGVMEAELHRLLRALVASQPSLAPLNDPVVLQLLVYTVMGLPLLLLSFVLLSLVGGPGKAGAAGQAKARKAPAAAAAGGKRGGAKHGRAH
jgi:hypothetical protein